MSKSSKNDPQSALAPQVISFCRDSRSVQTAVQAGLSVISGSSELERLTVRALDFSRIHLVGAHLDALERTVIALRAVVCTLIDTAVDRLVRMTFHCDVLLCLISSLVWTISPDFIPTSQVLSADHTAPARPL